MCPDHAPGEGGQLRYDSGVQGADRRSCRSWRSHHARWRGVRPRETRGSKRRPSGRRVDFAGSVPLTLSGRATPEARDVRALSIAVRVAHRGPTAFPASEAPRTCNGSCEPSCPRRASRLWRPERRACADVVERQRRSRGSASRART